MDYLLVILLVLMIISALIALETENLLSAIISLGAIGLLLSITFLFLGALEIAITQIVVEVLLLLILIRATLHRDFRSPVDHRERFGMLVGVTLIILLSVFAVRVFSTFPDFGSSVMDRFPDTPALTYLREGLQRTGAPNIICAVILDFRAYDTLGEITILFCAIVGSLAILRRSAHKRPKDKDRDTDAA
ncbi:DUF4040 domain-containing protein [candidate division FCPU426 bacterium]|nr:DUF4040 domain-containing protein [candidate division FCPU426 bacterium]